MGDDLVEARGKLAEEEVAFLVSRGLLEAQVSELVGIDAGGGKGCAGRMDLAGEKAGRSRRLCMDGRGQAEEPDHEGDVESLVYLHRVFTSGT